MTYGKLVVSGLAMVAATALCFDAGPLLAIVGAEKMPADVGPFTITFLTGTFPATITLGANYTGPDNAALAEYDPGDGTWRTYTDKTITRLGSYIAFRGDWRTSAGTYNSMFRAALQSATYTCEFSGAFTAYPSHAYAYASMFRDCSAVTGIRDNPVPVLTGAPAVRMFRDMCNGMSNVTGPLPAGFADTSGLTGAPAAEMFYWMCYGMSGVTGPLPAGFADTSGLTGALAASMYTRMCYGMSGVTGPLPAGFADTSGLTGAPTEYTFVQMCEGMTAITSGNIIIGENLTLDAANVVALTRMMYGCGSWAGEVFWGSDLLVDQVTPSTRLRTFDGCINMPGYADIHANWK